MAPEYRVRESGFHRVYLGEAGIIAAVGLPITETWTHADQANNLDADYDWTSVVSGWGISSNKASLANAGGAARIERLNVDLQTNDFRVRMPVVTFPTDRAGTQVIGVCCRMATSGSTFYTCSLLCTNAGPISLVLSRWVSGVATTLKSITLPSISLPSDLAVSAKGSVIGGWWGGRRYLLAVDSAIPANPYGGIQGVAQGSSNIVEGSQVTMEVVPPVVRRVRGLTGLGGVR